MRMYRVIDLFAGAGGLSLGFQQTKKFNIKIAFENNPVMQSTYKRNHPEVDVRGDVCCADYSEIQKTYGPIDVVIGGPPCQGFSNANRQRSQAVNNNNALVKEYIRAIREIKPKAFVMENVSMLKSDVHRFFLEKDDKELAKRTDLELKITPIRLLDNNYCFEGVKRIVRDEKSIKEYLWPAIDYSELNIIYKATRNNKKLLVALSRHEQLLESIAHKHIKDRNNERIKKADAEAFSAILGFYNHKLTSSELLTLIEPAIMYQRMLKRSLEILTNGLIVDDYSVDNGLTARVRSFAVFDYLKALLCSGEGSNGYSIAADVLSATDFGAPQKRMRFVIVGIRKDISTEVKLPQGKFKGLPCQTVYDAISDLENIDPVFGIADDSGIPLKKRKNLRPLAKTLRDASLLRNHIITKTTDVAMERFKALKQGENFHALDESLKTNTFTDASRTQNTVYLRLDYSKPSGTVVNIRKSMWIHPVKDRAVSVREAARLQTFPDSFIFNGSKDKQYQQVGNAVPPIMARAIAEELAKQLNRTLRKAK